MLSGPCQVGSLLFTFLSCLFLACSGHSSSHETLTNDLFVNRSMIDIPLEDPLQDALFRSMASDLNKSAEEESAFYHILHSKSDDTIELTDGSTYKIGWWYTSSISSWAPGDRLAISYHLNAYYYDVTIRNVDRQSIVYGLFVRLPYPQNRDQITNVYTSMNRLGSDSLLILKSGWQVEVPASFNFPFDDFKVNDEIYIFHEKSGYALYNITSNKLWILGGFLSKKKETQFDPALLKILELESRLNQRVLGQSEATKAVADSLLNYTIGLTKPGTPIGVFLFLGPTGVGKTELAKALVWEFYKNPEVLIRLDMSHYTDGSLNRLIGSPKGFAGNEAGGELTNALQLNSESLVLLDEIEKAHPIVLKLFLSVFDDGYIQDANNILTSCQKTLFIMTSNLCGSKIADLLAAGYTPDQVLEKIEPELMEKLSPELYNRVQPILFHPLTKEMMAVLVDKMLKGVVERLKEVRGIQLSIDSTVHDYLIREGFHPTLGARPLKRLIQNRITTAVSYAIASKGIPNGCLMTISYFPLDDSWHVYWTEQSDGEQQCI